MMERRSRALASILTILSMVGVAILVPPELQADRGSVRHSGKSGKSGKSSRSSNRGTTTRTTTTRTTTNSRPGTRPGNTPGRRPAGGNSARRGYRAGYSRGRYHGWHDARTSWRRWRAVTGLFKLGVYAATRPKQTTTVVVTGATYYYAGGVYYQSSGSGYVVVAAPPGAVVYSVPTYSTVVYVDTTEYVYVNGTYYVPTTKPAEAPPPPDPNATTTASAEAQSGEEDPSDVPMIEADDAENYEVVAPPAGATVPYLPDEADEETVQGKKYFVYDGTYYRAFASDGDTVYMVVEDPTKQG